MPTRHKEIETIFNEYMKERNNVPDYAKILAQEHPEFLIAWGAMRRTFRGKGVLPEKFKEILLIATNAIRLSETGVEMHIEAATKMGATKQEIVEAGLSGVFPVGGLTSLNVILTALMKGSRKKKK